MDGFEIYDGGSASHVEQVFANAEVTGAPALLATEMCEAMFHGDSLTETFTYLSARPQGARRLKFPVGSFCG